QFQLQALQCDRTVLLETGPGHAIRCFDTPFVAAFQREKERLLDTKRPHEEVRAALEELNLGRLRIASKGIKRHFGADGDPDRPRYLAVSAEEQHSEGMYMSGQIAALRDRTTTIEALHREVAAGGTAFLKAIPAMEAEDAVSGPRAPRAVPPCDVAI